MKREERRAFDGPRHSSLLTVENFDRLWRRHKAGDGARDAVDAEHGHRPVGGEARRVLPPRPQVAHPHEIAIVARAVMDHTVGRAGRRREQPRIVPFGIGGHARGEVLGKTLGDESEKVRAIERPNLRRVRRSLDRLQINSERGERTHCRVGERCDQVLHAILPGREQKPSKAHFIVAWALHGA